MLYRQAGIFHTNYASDRALFNIPFERRAIVAVLLLALAAPWLVSSLVLTSYLKPWLIWTAAVLGLNLILGWAGQFHFGYAAIMGIGAYASVHATRHGVPWEIAVGLGGVTAPKRDDVLESPPARGLLAALVRGGNPLVRMKVRNALTRLENLAEKPDLSGGIGKLPSSKA